MDSNRTQMIDPNRTVMGTAPTINATQTIKPVQCPVCKSMNPPGVMFCVDCGLIFEMALDGDAFGAPTVQLPVLVDSIGREFVLRPGEQILGRLGDIVVDDANVSRRHARLTLQGGSLWVEDLGSSNGTKLNGEPVLEKQPVPADGKLDFGGVVFSLSMPGEVAKTSMPVGGRTAQMAAAPTASPILADLVGDTGTYPLKSGVNTFGRREGMDVRIQDPYVSGSHGEIVVKEDVITLTDKGSTNGTVIDGEKIAPEVVVDLDADNEIQLGALKFKIVRR